MSQIALRRFYTNSPHKFAQLYSILEQILEIPGYSMCSWEAEGLELNSFEKKKPYRIVGFWICSYTQNGRKIAWFWIPW